MLLACPADAEQATGAVEQLCHAALEGDAKEHWAVQQSQTAGLLKHPLGVTPALQRLHQQGLQRVDMWGAFSTPWVTEERAQAAHNQRRMLGEPAGWLAADAGAGMLAPQGLTLFPMAALPIARLRRCCWNHTGEREPGAGSSGWRAGEG